MLVSCRCKILIFMLTSHCTPHLEILNLCGGGRTNSFIFITIFYLTSVFGHRDNPAYLNKYPRVVVISYTMLKHLRKSMLDHEWALLIVDESHHLRCSRKSTESAEVNTSSAYFICVDYIR